MRRLCTLPKLCLGLLLPAAAFFSDCVWAGVYPLSWGLNQASYLVPTNAISNVTAIAAGYHHNLALKDNRVWAWGDNTYGQTNVPAAAQSGVANIAGGGYFSLALKTNGSVVSWGAGVVATNVPPAAGSDVTYIAGGEYHALAVKDGGVIAWGSNSYDQCNVPSSLTSGVTAVAGGGYFSVALKEDGGVEVFGIPATNTLAYGIHDVPAAATSGVSAIAAGKWHALALKDGGVIAWGATNFYDPTNYLPDAVTSGVAAISAGDLFSIALKTNGTIVVWGDDTKGQLPVPAWASNDVGQVAAGDGHCLVVSSVLPPRFLSANIGLAYTNIAYTNGSVLAAGDPAVTYYPGSAWPGWMTIDLNTGVLGGTPSIVGTIPFSVVASNQYGSSTNTTYTVTVLPAQLQPPVFYTTSPIPDGVVGAPYSQQIVASNGNITFSLVAGEGNLPAGLSLDEAGLVSGIPTAVVQPAIFFRVRASNEVGAASNTYLIAVNPPDGPPEFLTTNPLPYGVVGQVYTQQLVFSNYPTAVTLQSGALPAGLEVNSGGLISGIPTQTGISNFTLRATNLVGATNQAYDLEIKGPPVFLTISPLTNGTVGVPYSQQIEAYGEPVFSLFAGGLPAGLGLTPAGWVTGTPVTVGTSNFTVRATNDFGSSNHVYALEIGAAPEFITTSPLPNGAVGVPYSQPIDASGSPVYSVVAGGLPAGVELAASGWVTGTPTTVGTSNFTVRATNTFGYAERAFDLQVGTVPTFITTSPLPNGVVGALYSQQIEADGTAPLTFSVVAGEPPAGLGLTAAGLVTGTPAVAGTSNFTVRATNDFGFADRAFDLFILGQNPPFFTAFWATNGGVRMAWSNPNPSGSIQVWRTTNIIRDPVAWSNLGVQTSPWTNTAPTLPAYYQLHLVP